ncbi:MAG: hypothetical protein JRI68_15730 [Deltaproteobacteria bacterium]|nr:hypothetical protein [Deltaproteobacteria bacterium]
MHRVLPCLLGLILVPLGCSDEDNGGGGTGGTNATGGTAGTGGSGGTAATGGTAGTGGTGGTASSGSGGAGGAGGAAQGGGGAGGGAAGAGGGGGGCISYTACANCLTTTCASQLIACDNVPVCLSAQFPHADCLQQCLKPSPACWADLETAGGSAATVLRQCAAQSCPACGA